MLTPGIDNCTDLLAKLERERYRAFHSASHTHQADHFYNFCITAQALKDHVLESLGANRVQTKAYHTDWDEVPELVAVSEIANTAKHCVLRYRGSGAEKPVATKDVRSAKTTMLILEVEEDAEVREEEHPTIEVTLPNGNVLNLFGITSSVVGYWQQFFDVHKIPRRSLDIEDMIDGA